RVVFGNLASLLSWGWSWSWCRRAPSLLRLDYLAWAGPWRCRLFPSSLDYELLPVRHLSPLSAKLRHILYEDTRSVQLAIFPAGLLDQGVREEEFSFLRIVEQ